MTTNLLYLQYDGKRSIKDNPTTPSVSKKSKRMFTRKYLYRTIENNLDGAGFNGTACLLKTICETAESDLYENNGVFGNLFHIIFT